MGIMSIIDPFLGN